MNTNNKKINPIKFATKVVWVIIGMLLAYQIINRFVAENYSFLIDTQDSRCIPEYSVYFQIKKFTNVERNGIYVFKASGLKPFFKDGVRMGKYAAGIAGDSVEINDTGVFINGELKAKGLVLAQKLSRTPKSYYASYQIPIGKVFFMGTADRSYDSRYWGLADISQIKGKAIPLW